MVQVRRFRCHNPACSQNTFVECLADWLPKYARFTARASKLITEIGYEVGGEAGRRILRYFRVSVSGDTILRRVRQAEPPILTPPRVIGVDDWALKTGRNYGTIVIDLEAHRVVDLFLERTASALSTWLLAHPDVQVIARDRSTDYAAGIQTGHPDAVQVADRWHLLVNLRQMVERFVSTIYSSLEPLVIPPEQAHLFPPQGQRSSRTKAEHVQTQTSRLRRIAQYEQIQQLRREGYNISQIARLLQLHRETVRKNFYATQFPERKQRQPENSLLAPFLAYLEQRQQAGCENAMQLWREIAAMGYPGSHKQVHTWLHLRRTHLAPTTPKAHLPVALDLAPSKPSIWQLPSVKQLTWLLVHQPERLTQHETIVVAHLRQHSDIARLYPLVQQFASMIRHRHSDVLESWLQAALDSGIMPLYHFALTLQQEASLIRAALEMPWSNGQTEGHVNRLKFIKRQMYGRAHFDLLRLRVLHSSGST